MLEGHRSYSDWFIFTNIRIREYIRYKKKGKYERGHLQPEAEQPHAGKRKLYNLP